MTIIGAWIVDQATAFIWADSEVYRDKKVIDHQLKLAINTASGVAGTHAGRTIASDALQNGVDFASSFDELLIGLPVLLRDVASTVGYLPDVDNTDPKYGPIIEIALEVPRWLTLAVGWSRRMSRMMGVTLQAERSFFAPKYFTGHVSSPIALDFASMHPKEPADIIGYAQAQARELRKSTGIDAMGTLTVAHVRRNGISVTPFDLQWGSQLALPNDLAGKGCRVFAGEHNPACAQASAGLLGVAPRRDDTFRRGYF
jgi:hypothetical protein